MSNFHCVCQKILSRFVLAHADWQGASFGFGSSIILMPNKSVKGTARRVVGEICNFWYISSLENTALNL